MKKNTSFISVGEPWDFSSPDGQNIVTGSIVKILSPTCLVFHCNHFIELDNVRVDLLVLSPRYSAGDFYELGKGTNSIVINGAILLKSYRDNSEEKDLMGNSKFVIIGSINIS